MKNTLWANGRVVVFDGAMGTQLYERGFFINRPFEELNESAPADVRAIHESYIQAGADVISTNSFSIPKPQLKKFDIEHKQCDLLTAALKIANEARASSPNKKIQVAMSLGPMGVLVEPLGPTSLDEVRTEYADLARCSKKSAQPFDYYLLETFTNVDELISAIEGLRSIDLDTPIIASMSSKSNRLKQLTDFAKKVGSRTDISALGLNCSEGPSDILTQLQTVRAQTDKPILIQPNAGIPRHLNGRYFYMTSPDYMAKYAKRFVEAGANAVGSCCGTTPEHTMAIAAAVKMSNVQKAPVKIDLGKVVEAHLKEHPRRPWSERKASTLGERLARGEKIISMELPPPKGIEIEGFIKKIDQLIAAGVHFANVPDGPRASSRVSAMHVAAAAARLRPGQITVIPHYTTRDRNLIALQADLLGGSINGVNDVLLVTGDPPKVGNNKDATGVYDIDSIGLTHLVDRLNRGLSSTGDEIGRPTNFGIGVASNPTAVNLEQEIKRWHYKVEAGADFTITQPIFDADSLLRWLDKIGADHRPHLVGIWPLISLRNAEFMANEVPGVFVPKSVLESMERFKDNPADCVKLGLDISRKVMERLQSHVAGFCISAPLGKVDVALELIR